MGVSIPNSPKGRRKAGDRAYARKEPKILSYPLPSRQKMCRLLPAAPIRIKTLELSPEFPASHRCIPHSSFFAFCTLRQPLAMILSIFAAGLLLVPSANAFWRLPCAVPVLEARVDPIVNPGRPSGHSHTIMGSNAIGYSTSFADLRNSQCSTCKVRDDRSVYWIPHLMYEHTDGSFEPVSHGGMVVYYIQRSAEGETVQAFPDGLRMFTGNPFARSNAGTPESQAISWNCIDFNDPSAPQTPGFANTHCPDGLRAQVFFPSCWDGQNLDSSDHKSHMAYPDGVDSGRCPSSHPIHLISVFYEVWFNVAPFNALNDGGRFVLSNGDPTGYGLHGDFMNGWDRSVLARAVDQCTSASGVIEDCPVFQNENRFNADADMNSCAAPNPLPSEPISGRMPYLPGCVAVTEGPAPATSADLVPGCMHRRSELGLDAAVNRPRWHRALRGLGSSPSV